MSERRNIADEPVIDPQVLDVLLEAVAPVAPPDGLRAQVLERIHKTVSDNDFITLPGHTGWVEWFPGVEIKRLSVDEQAGTKSFLLRAQAGVSLPEHGHQGLEECMVLEGEFTMGDMIFRAGDYHAAAAGTTHGMTSTRTGVTVYLRAAIADYPGV
jgi:anti-sigma factor ChrR (cupin superfamily)